MHLCKDLYTYTYCTQSFISTVCPQTLGCDSSLAATPLNRFTAQKALSSIMSASIKKRSLITTNRTNLSNFLNPVIVFSDRISICQKRPLIPSVWWNIGCMKEVIMLASVFAKAKHDPRLWDQFMKDSAVVWHDIFPDTRKMERWSNIGKKASYAIAKTLKEDSVLNSSAFWRLAILYM